MRMIFERSPTTDKVIDLLRSVNGEIEYKTLAKLAEIEESRLKMILPTARRFLKKEKILFGCIWGFGLRRLVDIDKVKKSDHDIKKLTRGTTRSIQDLDTIEEFDRLSNIDQITATTNRLILNATRSQLTMKPGPKKEKPTSSSDSPPSTKDLIRLMKNIKNE